MDASIISVSWNVKDHLRSWLQSIEKHTTGLEYEVIVVDNDSKDGSSEMVDAEFPYVSLIASTVNLGFGKANNRGVEMATGEVVLIMNDDMVLHDNAVKALVDRVQSDRSIGVLGCHLINSDGSHQDSVRRFPQLLDQLIILLKLHHVFPRANPMKRYLARDFDYSKEQDVDQVMGAVMVMRQEVYQQVGGFDEDFFVWFEEVDLCRRVQEQLGLRVVYTPDVEIEHAKGASFSQVMSATNQRRFNKSMRTYFRKHHPLSFVVIALVQPISLLLAWFVGLFHLRSSRSI